MVGDVKEEIKNYEITIEEKNIYIIYNSQEQKPEITLK